MKVAKKKMGKRRPARVVVREEYCMGCRLCSIWCTVAHSNTKDIIKTFKIEKEQKESGIYFEEKGAVTLAVQCRHCEDAWCVSACLGGAMFKEEERGLVLHRSDKCIGCWMCIMVCPYGVIKPDPEKKKIASKCDLCVEVQFPYCVEHCPNDAMILIDENGERIYKDTL